MNPINSMKPALPPTPHRSVAPARQLSAAASQSVTHAHCFLSNGILNSQSPSNWHLLPWALHLTDWTLALMFWLLVLHILTTIWESLQGSNAFFIVLQPYLDEISLGMQFNCVFFLLSVSLLCFASLKRFKGFWREKQVIDVSLLVKYQYIYPRAVKLAEKLNLDFFY